MKKQKFYKAEFKAEAIKEIKKLKQQLKNAEIEREFKKD